MIRSACEVGSLCFLAFLVGSGCGSSDDPGNDAPGDNAAGGDISAGGGGSVNHGNAAGGTHEGGNSGSGNTAGSSGSGSQGGSFGGGGNAGGAAGRGGASADGGVALNPDAGPVRPLSCSTDAAAKGVWQDVTPPQVPIGTNGSGVPNVVANPLMPGEIYVSTDKKGIFRSSDCGASWSKVNTGRNAATLDSGTAWLFVIDPITPTVMYADTFLGTASNLFKTTNGGVDWDPLWAAGGSVAKAAGAPELLAIDPTNHLHLVANFHQNCNSPYSPVCFGESTDGGETWRIVNGPPELKGWAEDASPIVVNSTTFLLGSGWSPLYLTKDDGASWTQVSGSGGLRMVQENGWYYVGAAFSIQRSQDLTTWISLAKTPGLVGFGLATDGQTLFASSRYHVDYAQSPVSNGATWTEFATPTKLVNPSTDGAYSLAIDTSHHLLYSASQGSGLWRMLTTP